MLANHIDKHIGYKIKARRKLLKMSQYALAFDLGISFQQLQKYESGQNRVSASKLYEIAKILKISPDFFFEGLEIFEGAKNNSQITVNLNDVMLKIKNQKVKEKILNLIIELGI